MPATVEELISLFEVTRESELTFKGPQPHTKLQRLFGGQVLAQSLVAAMHTVPSNRVAHSLNAYFLRPGNPDQPLTFAVEVLRDGRTFSARRVVTSQAGRVLFQLVASFQRPEVGLAHSAVQPADVTDPAQAPALREVLQRRIAGTIDFLAEWDALDVRLASRPEATAAGGSVRAWVRTQGALPDDAGLHAAVAAYLSDVTLLGVSTVTHEVEFGSPDLEAASIDHAMWFHHPLRADEWLLYDMVSPSASGGRGFSQGRLFQGGLAVASCAQEGLIRVLR
ncbi:MAG: acyl-CoA thioesterase [Arachnia sp.]